MTEHHFAIAGTETASIYGFYGADFPPSPFPRRRRYGERARPLSVPGNADDDDDDDSSLDLGGYRVKGSLLPSWRGTPRTQGCMLRVPIFHRARQTTITRTHPSQDAARGTKLSHSLDTLGSKPEPLNPKP
jgi:hypothetical protein